MGQSVSLQAVRGVFFKLVGRDKPNTVARLTGALQEIGRLDPDDGYTLTDAQRIAEDGLANPPDYIWPVRSERDEAHEQAISDLIEKIANWSEMTPEELALLEEITGHGK